METPQACRRDWLKEGIEITKKQNISTTDEVSVLESIGKKVSLFNLEYPNPKITSHSDWANIEFLISMR